MKVSVITAVYNNKSTIADTIQSVKNQSYEDIEYIIIDGASTDGTIDVIKQYLADVSIFISEPDRGIYDGLNKGISNATGDIICFLHSDDLYQDNFVIEKVVNLFKKTGCDSLYGDLTYVSKDNTDSIVRFWRSGYFHFKKLKYGWMPPHPTFFVKAKIYKKYGTFDTSLRISADYDSMLRFLGKEKISITYLPQVLIKMRVGGESNNSIKNLIRKTKEDYHVIRKNKTGNVGTLVIKNISKIPQFFRKK
jgi:glycosyltransferase